MGIEKRREKIQEGMRIVLSDCLARDDLLASDIVQLQLEYLDSEDCVLKVEKELPFDDLRIELQEEFVSEADEMPHSRAYFVLPISKLKNLVAVEPLTDKKQKEVTNG